MSQYIKPETIKNNMGGEGLEDYSSAMLEIIELLRRAPSMHGKVLDIGLGGGQIANYFLDIDGNDVTSIGLEIDSYGTDLDTLRKRGLSVYECYADNMPFEDNCFDIVVASHVLEHVGNLENTLKEIKRVLRWGGYFYVFVPPYNKEIISGHINTGWNIGQLMYVLLLNGFDVKNGNFIKCGYSVCAYVRKEKFDLPPLRGDEGDIQILDEAGLWPWPVNRINGIADKFYGEILALNWQDAEHLIKTNDGNRGRKIIRSVASVMHRIVGDQYFNRICELFLDENNSKKYVNPKILK